MQIDKIKLSVIIPCYNDGENLPDAVNSIVSHPSFPDQIKIIIVNDGSDDPTTIDVIQEIEKSSSCGIEVINQENKGLASARNYGISKSNSEIVILLDSDNKLTKRYLDIGLVMADGDHEYFSDADVVYGRPILIGELESSRIWETGPFNKSRLLLGNYIDACAIIRKSLWEKNGGFDEKMPVQGHEDWDFWIRSIGYNARFKFVEEDLFYYRIRKESMISAFSDKEKLNLITKYVYSKNIDIVRSEIRRLYFMERIYEKDKNNPFRSFLKNIYYKFFSNAAKTD